MHIQVRTQSHQYCNVNISNIRTHASTDTTNQHILYHYHLLKVTFMHTSLQRFFATDKTLCWNSEYWKPSCNSNCKKKGKPELHLYLLWEITVIQKLQTCIFLHLLRREMIRLRRSSSITSVLFRNNPISLLRRRTLPAQAHETNVN